jgi:hydrogenase nickel incorporation protein HypA/HybF
MHELSIAMNIVDGVLEEAARHGCTQVGAVHLRLGPLSGVDQNALLFAYPLACEGTILESSRLEITAAESNELEITAFETAGGEAEDEVRE